MAVQIRVTTTVVGGEVTLEMAEAAFGQVHNLPEVPADSVKESPVDRVLEPDSSMVAPGLSLQLA
jgi:hypothetical protein